MSILEAYRGLISAGFVPRRTVEFHWYAAEVTKFPPRNVRFDRMTCA